MRYPVLLLFQGRSAPPSFSRPLRVLPGDISHPLSVPIFHAKAFRISGSSVFLPAPDKVSAQIAVSFFGQTPVLPLLRLSSPPSHKVYPAVLPPSHTSNILF